MPSQRRSPRRRTIHEQLELLERIHADEVAETETDRHVQIRRVSRLFSELFPELGRVRAWMVATDIFTPEVPLAFSQSKWEALRAAADGAIVQHKGNYA